MSEADCDQHGSTLPMWRCAPSSIVRCGRIIVGYARVTDHRIDNARVFEFTLTPEIISASRGPRPSRICTTSSAMRRRISTLRGSSMRTVCTALAFLIILLAVLPAVRRSVSATRQNADSHASRHASVLQACSVTALRRGECHAQHHGEHADCIEDVLCRLVEWQGAPRDWMAAPFIFGQ